MNESIQSMDKYLWSACPVPRTAHYKREWNGAQGRQTSRTIAKVYISREDWVTSWRAGQATSHLSGRRAGQVWVPRPSPELLISIRSRPLHISVLGTCAVLCQSHLCFNIPWGLARRSHLIFTTSRHFFTSWKCPHVCHSYNKQKQESKSICRTVPYEAKLKC